MRRASLYIGRSGTPQDSKRRVDADLARGPERNIGKTGGRAALLAAKFQFPHPAHQKRDPAPALPRAPLFLGISPQARTNPGCLIGAVPPLAFALGALAFLAPKSSRASDIPPLFYTEQSSPDFLRGLLFWVGGLSLGAACYYLFVYKSSLPEDFKDVLVQQKTPRDFLQYSRARYDLSEPASRERFESTLMSQVDRFLGMEPRPTIKQAVLFAELLPDTDQGRPLRDRLIKESVKESVKKSPKDYLLAVSKISATEKSDFIAEIREEFFNHQPSFSQALSLLRQAPPDASRIDLIKKFVEEFHLDTMTDGDGFYILGTMMNGDGFYFRDVVELHPMTPELWEFFADHTAFTNWHHFKDRHIISWTQKLIKKGMLEERPVDLAQFPAGEWTKHSSKDACRFLFHHLDRVLEGTQADVLVKVLIPLFGGCETDCAEEIWLQVKTKVLEKLKSSLGQGPGQSPQTLHFSDEFVKVLVTYYSHEDVSFVLSRMDSNSRHSDPSDFLLKALQQAQVADNLPARASSDRFGTRWTEVDRNLLDAFFPIETKQASNRELNPSKLSKIGALWPSSFPHLGEQIRKIVEAYLKHLGNNNFNPSQDYERWELHRIKELYIFYSIHGGSTRGDETFELFFERISGRPYPKS